MVKNMPHALFVARAFFVRVGRNNVRVEVCNGENVRMS